MHAVARDAIRRGLLFAGLFLIPVGAITLLVRAGTLDAEAFADIWRFWPLILIGFGIAILLGRSRVASVGTAIAAVVLGVARRWRRSRPAVRGSATSPSAGPSIRRRGAARQDRHLRRRVDHRPRSAMRLGDLGDRAGRAGDSAPPTRGRPRS